MFFSAPVMRECRVSLETMSINWLGEGAWQTYVGCGEAELFHDHKLFQDSDHISR
jgi:hypothetical protein